MTPLVLTAAAWRTHPGALVALWTDAGLAYALFHDSFIATPLQDDAYPALSPRHPGAAWFERLARDLNGHSATGAQDMRPAIEQLRAADGSAPWPEFTPAPGEGVHQIAAGPVQAGIIEPGHFRFSVRGEQVLKLEVRLGYAHKATLSLMRGKSPRLAARYAARISGDATVAHSLAFAHATEAALHMAAPPRAQHLRAVMAELERIANHAGDLGAIAAAAGFGLLEARFSWHRERICQAAAQGFGHRLMMDAVIPGGIAGDLRTGGAAAILAALESMEHERGALVRLFEDNASLQDRLLGTGVIPPALAAAYAAGGVTGRAAGRHRDARLQQAPYATLDLAIPDEQEGDAAARVRVRLAELWESSRLIRVLLETLPDGHIAAASPAGDGAGIGIAESFRGQNTHWLRIEAGMIADIFIADASTLHWPLLEYAATTSSLADFPLLERSINPSCSGVDL